MNLIIEELKIKLKPIFKKDDERSQKVFNNTIISFLVRGGSILVGLLLVPMTINYINPIQYGIWLTISSIAGWMSFFDVGMGNGLRNKLTHCIAINEFSEAKKYVSTTYAILGIISFFSFFLFSIVNFFINWKSALNMPSNFSENIQIIMLVVFGSFSIQFVFQLINTILLATHESSKSSIIAFMGQCLILLTVFILKKNTVGNLLYLVSVLTIIPLIILLISSIFLFKTKLKIIAPSFNSVDFSYAKKVLNIGGIFFIIQIGTLILFQTDNIIISKILGPEAVTQFNISYKLFSIVILFFSIIITPYWSSFTDAFSKQDFIWMRKSMNKMRMIWIFSSLSILPLLVISSEFIYSYWIGSYFKSSLLISISMSLYVCGYTCIMLNCYFLNGVSKLKIQLYLYVFSSIVNIPLGIYLGKFFGIAGIILSNVIIFILMGAVLWIQTEKVLNQNDSGIWSK